MGLRINTNLSSIAAQRQLALSQRDLESSMKQLASGSRFGDMTTGAADFSIAEHLRGQISGMKAARFNAQNANSFVQVAEGGLNEQNNILIRQRELAIQAASDTFSDTEREMLDLEYQQLNQESDRIAKTTTFGSHKLLAGEEKKYEFQVGAYGGAENIITYNSDTNTTTSALDMSGSGVSSKSDALSSIESIDQALQTIAKSRATFGAMQSRLQSVDNNAGVQIENLEAAHSRLADTDIAEAVSTMYKQQALQQYQLQVLGQANQFPSNIIKVIG
jgi:flagellin